MTHSGIKSDEDFVITHTWIADGKHGIIQRYVHVVGDTDEAVLRRMGYKFRLLDDDGHVYFHGFSADDSNFEPLDWATPRYGCTEIQYRDGETNEWKSL